MLVLGNSYHGFSLQYFIHSCFNTANIFWVQTCYYTSCIIHPDCSIPSDTSVYKDEVLTMLAVYIIIPTTVFIELLVSILAVKYDFHGQRSPRQVGQCPSCKQWLLQSIHVLALWNILIAIQLITMIATPISVLLFLNPQVTVLSIVFLLMVLVSLTLIVAYVPPVSLSAAKKEKGLWQCKILWTKVYSVSCDDCNFGTNNCTPCFV